MSWSNSTAHAPVPYVRLSPKQMILSPVSSTGSGPLHEMSKKTEIDKKITADRKVFHEPESITFLRN